PKDRLIVLILLLTTPLTSSGLHHPVTTASWTPEIEQPSHRIAPLHENRPIVATWSNQTARPFLTIAAAGRS
ncbi:hypothetical protein, partial [Arthrobacter sp. OV608]|uniref:hypothetical protein n=1 Tax=Arthrobacter sp. OV608 TaxID=1882768 RepID=UPI0008BB31CC